MFARLLSGLVLTALVAVSTSSMGCTKKADAPKGKGDVKVAQSKGDGKHDDWWCKEHGIPEHICSLCNEEFAAKCKKEGDWCKLHDRAQSQCFKCDPEKYAKFEKMYEEKFGKKPARPDKEEFEK